MRKSWSRSPVVFNFNGGSTITRCESSGCRIMKVGKTGAPVLSAIATGLYGVYAGRPKKSTKTPSTLVSTSANTPINSLRFRQRKMSRAALSRSMVEYPRLPANDELERLTAETSISELSASRVRLVPRGLPPEVPSCRSVP